MKFCKIARDEASSAIDYVALPALLVYRGRPHRHVRTSALLYSRQISLTRACLRVMSGMMADAFAGGELQGSYMRITDELGHAFDQDDVRILLSRSAHAAAPARSLPADRLVLGFAAPADDVPPAVKWSTPRCCAGPARSKPDHVERGSTPML